LVKIQDGHTSVSGGEHVPGPTSPFLANQSLQTAIWVMYMMYIFRTCATYVYTLAIFIAKGRFV